MAGLRFGYLMAHPEIASEIHKAKLPYNVNVFTLAAAELVLERPNVMKEAIQTLIAERERVLAELRKRPGVEAFDSCTNFFLIRTLKSARDLFEALYAAGRAGSRRELVSDAGADVCALLSASRRRTIDS